MSPNSVWDVGTGRLNNLSGQPVTYNPSTGTVGPTSGPWTNPGLGFGKNGPTFGPPFVFTNKKDK